MVENFQIRDRRKPGHHWADNEVMDVLGPLIGMAGYAVYMYICRHSDNTNGRCHRSHADIARAFGCHADTVQRHVHLLVQFNLILIENRPGKPCTYIVLEVPRNVPQIAAPLFSDAIEDKEKHLPQIAVPSDSKLRQVPTAKSGTHLPQIAVPLPQIAVPLPQIAAGTLYGSRALNSLQDSLQDLSTGEEPPHVAVTSPARIIAQQKLMEGIGKREPGDPSADEALFNAVRASAKRAGLNYGEAKIFLGEDPKWRRWRWFSHLDTQQEIIFPELSAKVVTPTWPEDFEKDGQLWFEILKELKKSVAGNSFDTWLKPTCGYGRWRGTYFVHIPTSEFRHIGKKFSDQIKPLLAGKVEDIRFVTEEELTAELWKVPA